MAFCAIVGRSRQLHLHCPVSLFHLQSSRFVIFRQYFNCRRRVSTVSMTSSAEEAKLTAPYGSWKSPITADIVSGSDKRLAGFAADSLGRLYWVESRPSESGRNVLVRQAETDDGTPLDITPENFAVRTVANEYGGVAFSISGDFVIFSNYKDQRLYKLPLSSQDSAPVPLTPDYNGAHVCYADGVFDARFNRYLTVMEDPRGRSMSDTKTTIASVDLCGNYIKEPKILVEGNDFYAFPRIDHKG